MPQLLMKRSWRWCAATVGAIVAVSVAAVVVGTVPAQAATPVSVSGAHWIWYPEGSPASSAPAADRYFRKVFTAPSGSISDAQLVITGDDTVDVWLNGLPLAGSPRLTDAWKRALYVDLQAALRPGAANTLALVVRNTSVGPAGVIGRVHVIGSSTVDFVTDGTWKASQAPAAGWEQMGFADSGWPAAVDLGAYGIGPWTSSVLGPDTATSSPLSVASASVERRANPLGVWIFDLGQNFTGWDQLRVTGPAGTTVTVRHGEVLNADGTLYTANLRVAGLATDRFTLAGTGSEELFEPRFTVHGYRYVELTGFPGTPTAHAVTGQAAWTSGPQLGTLTTSNNLINQLQSAIVWGQRSNMLSIPTDCPNRDERLGWTGDIASFAATSTFNVDVNGFLDKFADDLTDAQQSNGAFTDTAPYVCCGAGTAGWGDAGVIVPYTMWQRYGDTRVINDHFSAMTRWVDYLRGTAAADLIRDQGGYGDWLNVNDDTARNVISTAFFAHAARMVSQMAAATGHSTEASGYGTLADQVAAAFTSRFVAGDGTVSGNTQTGYVLALAFGLLPSNLVAPAVNKLVAKVAASGGHLTVGFLGVENLLPVLADNGRADIAYQILLQPSYPGWGYMLGRGATTIWERWDGIRPDGSFQDAGMNSFNHYGLGSVGDFLYRQIGGLGPAGPGYQSLLVAPRPGGGLTSAKSAYETPYGQAVSDWTSSGGVFTLRVTVPAGASALVKVPATSASAVSAPAQAVPFGYGSGAASYYLPAGSYTFTAPA